MKELYFILFCRISKNPAQKYCMALFHMLGAMAFLLSAVKHFQRRNRVGVVENTMAIFPQLLGCYNSALYSYNHFEIKETKT